MATFGEEFDLKLFKQAFETATDMEAYNRAQSVERGIGRVQNYVADLAIAGAKLAGLEPTAGKEGAAERAFATLRDAGVLSNSLCRRLKRAQKARTMIEHSYVGVPAGNVHAAAKLVLTAARDFIGPYRAWIEEYL